MAFSRRVGAAVARRWSAAALLLAPSLLYAGCTEPVPAPRSVLLITLDATRVDALSAYGSARARTPNLDRLAASGLRFVEAVSTTPYTGSAHASILTGVFPPQHGMRDFMQQRLSDDALTLAEILGKEGFATAAFVSGVPLDPAYGFSQGFGYYGADVWRPPAQVRAEPAENGDSFIERRAENTVSEVLYWLKTVPWNRPFFAWVHFYDPHAPYNPPPRFGPVIPSGASQLEALRALYYAEVTYMDSQIGRLLTALERMELYRNLVVVAVADHGELLGEHGREIRTHSTHLVDATLLVPLIVRVPGVAPAVIEEQVRIVDVFPTVLGALSLPVPAGIEGRDLVGRSARGRRDLPAYSETFYEHFPQRAADGEELRSLRYRGLKLVSRPGREELYDLTADPDELADASEARPDTLEGLRAELGRMAERWPEDLHAATLEMAPDELEAHREKLRALGYVE